MRFYKVFLPILLMVAFTACSTDNSEEKSGVEKATDKIAEEAVESIKKPLGKAEMAKELSEAHNQKIKESVE